MSKPTCPECGMEVEYTGNDLNKNITFYCNTCDAEIIVKRVSEENRVKWRKYPDSNLKGIVRDCIILKEDGSIEDSIFWTKEDSSHDHSPWQETEYYLPLNTLKRLPKEEVDR